MTRLRTAAGESLVNCHECGKLSREQPVPRGLHATCPRCGALVHRRKPASVARTWALVIAAAILYVPANYYPVMTIESFGHSEPSTILGGVDELIASGDYPVAAVLFFASITVPMFKLIGLSFLLVSVQRGWQGRPRHRAYLYRVIEYVGRWSMIDIFVLSILVALVRLGSLATIEPEFGALCFASVVVITMIAAESFDPRLIWDNLDEGTA